MNLSIICSGRFWVWFTAVCWIWSSLWPSLREPFSLVFTMVTMLAALKLKESWIYRKIQVLAIFDDLDTILLMIPLQILMIGLRWQMFAIVAIVVTFMQILTSSFAAYAFAKMNFRGRDLLFHVLHRHHRGAVAGLHGAPVHHDAQHRIV